MRPVNLIPPEERRDKAGVRSGAIAYLLIGALALVFVAVTVVVITNNRISDRKGKVAELQQQEAAARAQASQYAPFSHFASVEQDRHSTIKSLANSRFDWDRVMNELARVIPKDVWLTNLSGAVTAAQLDSSGSGGGGGAIDTSSIAGPALSLTGCAASQDSVASFMAALRDIDGVTRVGLASSDISDTSSSASTSTGDSANSTDSGCTNRQLLAQFQIVAAFDSVPTPPVAGAAPATATAAAAPADSSSTDSSSSDTSTTSAEPGT